MMPRSLIRNLTQLLVVLWLLISCLMGILAPLFSYDQTALAEPVVWQTMVLAILFPGAVACLLIVTPAKSGRFMVTERVEGAACYLCAALRGALLVKLTTNMMPVAMVLRQAVTEDKVHVMWIPVATLLAEFFFWVLFLWLAPWFSMAVVRQVDSGVMWYVRSWRFLKGLLNPDLDS